MMKLVDIINGKMKVQMMPMVLGKQPGFVLVLLLNEKTFVWCVCVHYTFVGP